MTDPDITRISAAVAAKVTSHNLVYQDEEGDIVIMMPEIVQAVLDEQGGGQ